MAELRPLFEGRVVEAEIDHLGHMNVRYYLEKALAATRALARELGLDAVRRDANAVLGVSDLFTRHFREQLVGAPLVVRGGVIGADGDGLRLYHELWNVEREELSASFVHEVRLEDADTRKPLPLPESAAARVAAALCSWPERGRPRTLDLSARPRALSLDEATRRGLAMREPRRIAAEECDEDGAYLVSRHQELVWGGVPLPPRPPGMPMHVLSDGTKFAWATLESRALLIALPRVGARIQSFGAEVAIADKTTVRHQWVFDLDSGAPVCASQVVNLAFDIDRRRAIPIPREIRAQVERQFHPDLR